MKLPFVRRTTADALRDKLTRAEERVAELEARPRVVKKKQPEASTDGPGAEDRDYAFRVLNRALPQFADIVTQNGGVLPDDNYEALSIYVNGASLYYGLSEAEVEELGVRHGIPAPILQKAKETAPRSRPADAA